MAAGQNGSGRTQLVPEAHQILDNIKYEIASEFGIPVYQGSEDYWGNIPSKDCGRVGGAMVKRMIALAEKELMSGKQLEKL
ncbi:MAG: alpha/beta-type small acid-soluble spore protein [Caloramator sp.]|jgi:small acid-soluble spore protein A (major alpha-type SASP)|uniref:Small acid-soluble spore protein A (Major alpha-type SASP) n=1 Tax=Caloramator proteoclasticus DSM 10124 TaxID=1121262 RepID=A0A1M4Z7H0_9CLOT|nr:MULTISPECIES: alpha/beta-type small acid-soluble spore protein [Caloramator]MBZ4664222.1 alpha/beta-type small acid-soluble spore protein [Caloramator sp.]SHF13536.1 small acid-soluble spore protein A (major alpha-type SASP) [Caloramator proteoclasticus DSM 10124]